jgi:ABC-type multidrug transport system permease subunit
MGSRVSYFLRIVWIVLKKDVRVWLRQPVNLAVIFIPAVGFLLVSALGTAAVGRSPVALVTLDRGPTGSEMRQIIHDADVFRITDATPEQARQLYDQIQVVAIITIPADFTQRVEAHQQAPIDVEVNNLNLDFTNDLRRAVPDAITQFYQAQGSSSPVKVTMQEQDLRGRDVELFEYSVVPIIVLLLTIGGVINGGVATSREWESRTIKELLLSPTPRSALVAGKVLANFVITFALGVAVLLVGALLGWTQPRGIYWLSALLAIALMALLSSGLGAALGAALQRMQPVIAIANSGSVYLFFLAGGIGVLAFAPDWLQTIASFVPLTYGRHALEMAVFYSSADLLGRDLLVLGASALVAVALGALAMRRGIAS